MLCKLPVPGRLTNMDYSRARAYCACSGCGWGWFGHFYSRLSFLVSFSLSLGGGPIWTEKLSQRAVKPKITSQPTNKKENMFLKFDNLIFFSWFPVEQCNVSKIGTMTRILCMYIVCAVDEWVKRWLDQVVLGSIPTGSWRQKYFQQSKRVFIAHCLPLSPSHPLDVTEII